MRHPLCNADGLEISGNAYCSTEALGYLCHTHFTEERRTRRKERSSLIKEHVDKSTPIPSSHTSSESLQEESYTSNNNEHIEDIKINQISDDLIDRSGTTGIHEEYS